MQKTLLEVENEYRKTIQVPKVKPTKQFFFCPVGLIGAGKTTITKPISERFNLVRLSSDELRELLKKNGYNYDSVKEIGYKIVTEYASQGYSIALDMDCGSLEAIDLVKKISEKFQAKAIWVHIDTPEDYIFEKFRKHPPTWLADNPQIMIDNYLVQKEKRMKENSQFNFLYTFDTSRKDINEQIEECAGRMEAF